VKRRPGRPRAVAPDVDIRAEVCRPEHVLIPTAVLARRLGVPRSTVAGHRAAAGLASPARRGGQRRPTLADVVVIMRGDASDAEKLAAIRDLVARVRP
jgi:hypothetical protein